MAGTVTATQAGSTDNGTHCYLAVITGQNASPIGVDPSAASTTPSLSTGAGVTSGSWVYASLLGLAGTYTATAASTVKQDSTGQGLEYVSARSTGTMTGGSAATIGCTATANGIAIALLEILKGTGLAEDASSPGPFGANLTTVTSGSFSPPAGSLLVLMVQTNGNAGVVTMGVTDTIGGLTWTEQVKQNTAGDGYTGIWTAPVPVPGASVPGLLMAAGII